MLCYYITMTNTLDQSTRNVQQLRQEPGELSRSQVLLQYIPKSSLFYLQSTLNVQELRQEPGEELSRSQVLLQYIP